MTERDLFEQLIPRIAEMIIEVRKLSTEEFQSWKQETIDTVPDRAKPFMGKIFVVVENNLQGRLTQRVNTSTLDRGPRRYRGNYYKTNLYW